MATKRRPPLKLGLFGLLVGISLGVSSCGKAPPAKPTGSLDLGACPKAEGIHNPALPSRASCGTLSVPEDPARPEGRTLSLRVARVPALDKEAKGAPLLVLVGGPGQAATEVGPHLLPAFAAVREAHELLFIDQRGTSSDTGLRCEWEVPDPYKSDDALTDLFRIDPPVERLAACRDTWDADLRFYTTSLAAADLEAALAALAIPQVNVYGASYGTRLALEFAARYPARVRSLILDGVAPHDIQLPMNIASGGAAALERAIADCEGQSDCRRAFPRLRADMERLRRELLAAPLSIEFAHPKSGRPGRARLQWPLIARLLYAAMMSDELRVLVPLALHQVSNGDFGALAAMTDALGASQDQVAYGLHLAVTCSEDMKRISAADRAQAVAADPDGVAAMALGQYEAMCALFPAASLPEDFGAPTRLEAPALILSGELDPATPPRWGEAVLGRLTRARHVVVPGTSHGCWRHEAVATLIARFLGELDPGALDTDEVMEIAPQAFFLSTAGPIATPPAPQADEEAP